MAESLSRSTRRPDIQGLRALAVIAVVAYHAGLPIPGGFVGVDIFFVISGFVITTMLYREYEGTGRIRFSKFYIQRFKRLTPALAVLISVTLLLSAAILSPEGPQQMVASTAVAAVLSIANFQISRSSGGYFAPAAELNPLLNTWSLSVEEQFYLFFPALMALGWFLARRQWHLRASPLFLTGSIAVLSFVLALVASMGWSFRGSDLLIGFYSPLSRAWEFAAGAILALVIANRAKSPVPQLSSTLAIGGLGMLIAAFWLINENTSFPGIWTLLPVIGTLFLLDAGFRGNNYVTTLLSSRPLVLFGDWSYSVYLWHWPFIVLSVYLWPTTEYVAVLAALVSLGPALFSYHWIEQPFRQRIFTSRIRLTVTAAAFMATPVLLAFSVIFIANNYWLPRWSEGERHVVVAPKTTQNFMSTSNLDITYFPCREKFINLDSGQMDELTACAESNPDTDVSVAIVGDSHASHLLFGLSHANTKNNVALYTYYGPPVKQEEIMAKFLQDIVLTPSIKTVIVSASWTTRNVPESGLVETIRSLTSSGKKVFVVDDVPHFPFHADMCKYGASPLIPISRCTMDYEDFERVYNTYYGTLKSAADQVPGSKILHSARYFCNDTTCDMTNDNFLMYSDTNHLNQGGSMYVVDQLLQDNPDFFRAIYGQD